MCRPEQPKAILCPPRKDITQYSTAGTAIPHAKYFCAEPLTKLPRPGRPTSLPTDFIIRTLIQPRLMLLILNMALPPSSLLLVLIFCLGPDFTNGMLSSLQLAHNN